MSNEEKREKSNTETWAEREVDLACKQERRLTENEGDDWDYGCACYDSAFFVDAYFFTPFRTCNSLWKDVVELYTEKCCQNLYFHNERNTANAPAYCGIFWSLLHFWNSH